MYNYIIDRQTSDKDSSNGEGIPSLYMNELSIKVDKRIIQFFVLCSQPLPYK